MQKPKAEMMSAKKEANPESELLEGVTLHVAALGAGTLVGGSGDKGLVWNLVTQSVEHSPFGDNHKGVGW